MVSRETTETFLREPIWKSLSFSTTTLVAVEAQKQTRELSVSCNFNTYPLALTVLFKIETWGAHFLLLT